jgi:hypothetical protein
MQSTTLIPQIRQSLDKPGCAVMIPIASPQIGDQFEVDGRDRTAEANQGRDQMGKRC